MAYFLHKPNFTQMICIGRVKDGRFQNPDGLMYSRFVDFDKLRSSAIELARGVGVLGFLNDAKNEIGEPSATQTDFESDLDYYFGRTNYAVPVFYADDAFIYFYNKGGDLFLCEGYTTKSTSRSNKGKARALKK